jgi:hypothetical protein
MDRGAASLMGEARPRGSLSWLHWSRNRSRFSGQPCRLRGGNWGCNRGALSRCSRSLQTERISLIGETEFVVPRRCNFFLNQLTPWDILNDGLGVRVVRSRFSLYLCALALAGPHRWSEQALPRRSEPSWFRRRLLFVGCRADALHRAASDLAPDDHRVDHRAAISISADRSSGWPPRCGPILSRPIAKLGLNDHEDLRHPLRAESAGAAGPRIKRWIWGKPR